MVKNAYPLPQISMLLEQLKGAKIFTKMDLRNRYNNVRIKAGDEWKAVFSTSEGLFEPTVMFFGLCNFPATFQAMMDDTFHDMINEGWLLIYLDDILISSKTVKEHQEWTQRVLQQLKDNNLFVKPEKCTFEQPQVEFLGFIVRENHLAMDPVKVKGILDWLTPIMLKEAQVFLGFGNFY